MAHAFNIVESRHTGNDGDESALSLHDPICVYYALTSNDPAWKPTPTSPEDIRIETAGQWTRGMCVVDRRNRHREDGLEESPSDRGLWLSPNAGNRIWRMDQSPCADGFGDILVERIFGQR
jgi:inosine-uridine nucleoside N-ribohydrolase